MGYDLVIGLQVDEGFLKYIYCLLLKKIQAKNRLIYHKL